MRLGLKGDININTNRYNWDNNILYIIKILHKIWYYIKSLALRDDLWYILLSLLQESQDFSYNFSLVLIQCYTFSCLIAEAIS